MSNPLAEPLQNLMERVPVQEMIERLPVQEVIEHLPQRMRPEPPKRSKLPLVLGIAAVVGIVLFVMMRRKRGGSGAEMDTGMAGVVPTTGASFGDSQGVGAAASTLP